MEKESFEDTEVAGLLNKYYVSIKVDREERPDVDHVYMTACQALTGSGGWPLTILMTPDRKPFFAGTYFPKHDRQGMPGLLTLLETVRKAWEDNRGGLLESSSRILDAISGQAEGNNAGFEEDFLRDAFLQFKADFDQVNGGFGSSPKFPMPHNLYFLLRYWHMEKDHTALEMVEKTLDSMYRGGIFDHIGYGFSRYSTDRKWLVPHFEKMLYDNALLAIAYLEAYQATGKSMYSQVAAGIFRYVSRDMTSPEGGFYSAEDADSEGEEGKFYLWTPDEVKGVLGDRDGERFCKYCNITREGNFEGKSIPNLINTTISGEPQYFIDNCRDFLFGRREARIRPHRDDKILTSWNGLMIAALALGGRVLGENRHTEAAEKAASFIYKRLFREDGRLLARYRAGESAFPAYADDYAFLIWGLIELYETTYKPDYLEKALNLNDDLLKLFGDDKTGGLFLYGSDSEQLITRPREIYDGAIPSGNSVAALNMLRLARLTGRHESEDRARELLDFFSGGITAYPAGHAFSLMALLFARAPVKEIILAAGHGGGKADVMLKVLHEGFKPFSVSVLCSGETAGIEKLMPFLADYTPVNGNVTAYVCQNFSCRAPVTDVDSFREILRS